MNSHVLTRLGLNVFLVHRILCTKKYKKLHLRITKDVRSVLVARMIVVRYVAIIISDDLVIVAGKGVVNLLLVHSEDFKVTQLFHQLGIDFIIEKTETIIVHFVTTNWVVLPTFL